MGLQEGRNQQLEPGADGSTAAGTSAELSSSSKLSWGGIGAVSRYRAPGLFLRQHNITQRGHLCCGTHWRGGSGAAAGKNGESWNGLGGEKPAGPCRSGARGRSRFCSQRRKAGWKTSTLPQPDGTTVCKKSPSCSSSGSGAVAIQGSHGAAGSISPSFSTATLLFTSGVKTTTPNPKNNQQVPNKCPELQKA